MDRGSSRLYEPAPRLVHVSCTVQGQVYVWGGRTPDYESTPAESDRIKLTNYIEQFDSHQELWQKIETGGNPHTGLSSAACTSVGEHIYVFGGWTIGSKYAGFLSCLNLNTLTWSLLSQETANGPMRKDGCGMVHFHGNKLAVIGGYGYPPNTKRRGSSFIRNPQSKSSTDVRGWSNEFDIYDLSQGVWISPVIKGTKLPPCDSFSLTSIDSHRAILFGGYQPRRGTNVSDLYLIEFDFMKITRLEQKEGEPWPAERSFHAACCLGYGGDSIHLLVIGGLGSDNQPLKDIWLFNLSLKIWKEVTIPDGPIQRWGHTASAITLRPGLEDIIVFGGCPHNYDVQQSFKDDDRIADTTIITFGQFGSEWMLVGVANNCQRGTNERVMEKMILKLDDGLHTQVVAQKLDQRSQVNMYTLYRLERIGIQVRRSINDENQYFQAVLRQKQPNATLAMIKWVNSGQQNNIKPTWKNLFLILRLIKLDHLAQQIETCLCEKTIVSGKTEDDSNYSEETKVFNSDSMFTMASLNHLEKGVGIPVLTDLEAANHEFQAIIRVKQPNILLAIKKWLTTPLLSHIKPTWKNLILILQIINLDQLAEKIETYVIKHQLSGRECNECTCEILRKENATLQQQLLARDDEIKTLIAEKQYLKEQQSNLTDDMWPLSSQDTKPVLKEESMWTVEETQLSMEQFLPSQIKQESQGLADADELNSIVSLPGDAYISTDELDSLTIGDEDVGTVDTSKCQLVLSEASEATPLQNNSILEPALSQSIGLRGVEVSADTTIVISNNPLDFEWKGFGLKLHIPKGCLPAGMEQCTIKIKASLAGQYEFPENCHLVSAIFWLHCEPKCRFTVPISMEIPHCARPENTSKLSFVKAFCSQKYLPYTFRQLGGGCFTSSSSYGIIEIDSFSGTGVTQNGPPEDREYIAQLFYLRQTISVYEIHLVVIWNLEAHLTVVKDEYHQKRLALLGPDQPVDFESEQIKLNIPNDGITVNGWKITPLIAPVVTKRHVDNYHPGKRIPCCQLIAEFQSTTADPVPTLCYKVELIGAKEPHNMFTIHSPSAKRPMSPANSSQAAGSSPKKPRIMYSQPYASPATENIEASVGSVQPELKDLLKELYTQVADKWEDIGIMLRIEDGQLKRFKHDHSQDSKTCLREMLRIWLSRVNPAPSWSAIAEALESLGYERLATHLKSTYCN